MKRLCKYTKYYATTSIRNLYPLHHQRRFNDNQQQKFQYISDTDELTKESSSHTNIFQDISSNPNSRVRNVRIDKPRWRTQIYRPNPNKYPALSGIINAKSVHEIHEQLQRLQQHQKGQYYITDNTNRKQRLLHLVDGMNTGSQQKQPQIQYTQISHAYCCAIETCGYLKEFDEGFKIFAALKQNPASLTQDIFAAVMRLNMTQSFSQESLNKCFQLLHAMRNKCKLSPSARTYATLIADATDLRSFHKANDLVRFILEDLDDNERGNKLKNRFLRNSIIYFYGRTMQIENALLFMNTVKQTLGSIDDVECRAILAGIALVIRQKKDKSMIEVAEKIFQQTFETLEKKPRVPDQSLFVEMLNVYAAVPDIHSCIDVIKAMLSNEKWPNPPIQAYNHCLMALTRYFEHPFTTYQEGWKYVDEVIAIMNENNVKRIDATYVLLFTLCGGAFCNEPDLKKLYKYYDEMEHYNIKLTVFCAESLFLSGIDHFMFEMNKHKDDVEQKELIKEELTSYIDWALVECKKYDIKLNKRLEQKIQNRLDKI